MLVPPGGMGKAPAAVAPQALHHAGVLHHAGSPTMRGQSFHRQSTSCKQPCLRGMRPAHQPPVCPSPLPVPAGPRQAGPCVILKRHRRKPCSRSQLEVTISPGEGSCPCTPCAPRPPRVPGAGSSAAWGRRWTMWGCPAVAFWRCLFASDGGRRQEGRWPGRAAVLGDEGRGRSPLLLVPLPALSHCAPTPALTRFLNR